MKKNTLVIIRERIPSNIVRVTHGHVTMLHLNENNEVTHINVEGIARMEIAGKLMEHESLVTINALPVATTKLSSVEVIAE
jgi:hypothetical protein